MCVGKDIIDVLIMINNYNVLIKSNKPLTDLLEILYVLQDEHNTLQI